MEEIRRIEDFFNLHGVSTEMGLFYIYRGHVSKYKKGKGEYLTPSIFRYEETASIDIEREIYTDFYNHVRMHAPSYVNLNNPWEALIYAQHIGVPTRLLDWTINPLIALYFAVEDGYKDVKEDGILFMLKVSEAFPQPQHKDRLGFRGVTVAKLPTCRDFLKPMGRQEQVYNPDLATKNGMVIVQPPIIDTRIQAQAGLFTVNLSDDVEKARKSHDSPDLLGEHIETILIKAEDKGQIKTQLYRMGIHAGSIYPDIAGLGKYLTERRDREYWVKTK